MFTKKDKSFLSLPEKRTVCGYVIKKLPIAPYLAAVEKLTTLPEELMAACFPGMKTGEVLETLTNLDESGLGALAGRAISVAPGYVIELVAELTGIDRKALLNDERIGLDGLLEIVDSFIEVNRLGECLSAARALMSRFGGLTRKE